jgi:Holliday junction resolvasome RuvABC DNA-binding subunit
MKVPNLKNEQPPASCNEDAQITQTTTQITKKELKQILTSVNGLGPKKFDDIIEQMGGTQEVVGVLDQSASILLNIKGITKKLIKKIEVVWAEFKGEDK